MGLICWLGHDNSSVECIQLAREMWSRGVAVDLLYRAMELETIEEIQLFCRRNMIPHIVIVERMLFTSRQQVTACLFLHYNTTKSFSLCSLVCNAQLVCLFVLTR